MDIIPLIIILAIFLLVVLIKSRVMKLIGWNVCALCAAVSLTWMILLLLIWSGVIHQTTSVAILMGMSVSGLMYKLEGYYKSHHLRHLWAVRLVVILGGFTTITMLISQNWPGLLLVGIGVVLLLVVISFLIQGTTHDDALQSADKGVKKSLLKKLDNCC